MHFGDLRIATVFDDADWPADRVSFTGIGISGLTFLQDPLERLSRDDVAQAAVMTAALLAEIADAMACSPDQW